MRTSGLVRSLQSIALVGSLLTLTTRESGCRSSHDAHIAERPDFGLYFVETGAAGTFVLYDSAYDSYSIHDLERANQRFIPASTFKILNSLIALETGVVPDTLRRFEWDGVERSIPQWNRDHTLASAFESSVVWVYQEIAREVGETRMNDFVRRTEYGNQDTGDRIDTFWLQGDLRISPMEQVRFLQRLHERSLPFSERTIDLVEGIMIEERGPGYVLHAKSGLADGTPHDIGWYVGYVVRGDSGGQNTYYFALEMDVVGPEQIALRRGIVRSILSDLGIL